MKDIDWTGATVFVLALTVGISVTAGVLGLVIRGDRVASNTGQFISGVLGACVGTVATYIGLRHGRSDE